MGIKCAIKCTGKCRKPAAFLDRQKLTRQAEWYAGHEGQPDIRDLATLSFDPEGPAVGTLKGVVFHNAGMYRLQAQCGGVKSCSNPSLCTPDDIPGIFWDDPHVHTVLSNCHPDKCRSLNFCFSAGRYVSALDWVAAADHVSGGRCEFAKWKAQSAASNAYNTPLEFVTLPAYEASLPGGRGGDNNVYLSHFPEMYSDAEGDLVLNIVIYEVEQTRKPTISFMILSQMILSHSGLLKQAKTSN